MTNTEIIQAIRNEIERLKSQLIRGACAAQIEMETNCKEKAYDEVLSFLSTLESEKPIEQEGLEEELDRFIASGKSVTVEDCGTYKVSYHDFKKVARHFAKWGAEHAKIDVTDFCKPIDPGIAQCVADHWFEMADEEPKKDYNQLYKDIAESEWFKKSYVGKSLGDVIPVEEPVCDDLEEAAKKSARKEFRRPYSDTPDESIEIIEPDHYEGFIAGANWQNEKDGELMAIVYGEGIKIGMTKQKEQMMKEAVEGTICKDEYRETAPFYYVASELFNLPQNIMIGDKVRIIIVKEN